MMHFLPALTELPQLLVSEKLAEATMLLIESGVFPLFARATAFALELLPTLTLPNDTLDGVRLTVSMPVPDKATAWVGFRVSLLINVIEPVTNAAVVGENFAVTVHLPFGASEAAQLLVWLKDGPDAAMLEITSGDEPVLLRVRFWLAVDPTEVFGNETEELENLAVCACAVRLNKKTTIGNKRRLFFTVLLPLPLRDKAVPRVLVVHCKNLYGRKAAAQTGLSLWSSAQLTQPKSGAQQVNCNLGSKAQVTVPLWVSARF